MADQGPIYSEFVDDKEMMELVTMFVDELPERLQRMEDAYAANDLATVQTVAHQIKGAAGGYGYPQLTEAAREVEATAKTRDPQQVRTALDQLTAMCKRTTAQVP